MFQEIVVENIPDELLARLVKLARSEGRTVEDLVRDRLIAAASEEGALQEETQRRTNPSD